MVKKTGEEIETPTNDNPLEVVESPEVVDTPTTEQQMETLQAELRTKGEELTKSEGSVQGLRGSLQEKDRLLGEQAAIRSEVTDLKDMIRTLASAQVRGESISGENLDDIPEHQRIDAKKVFDELEAKQEKRRQEGKIVAQKDEYNRQADAIYARAEAAFADDIDTLHSIRNLLRSGDSDLAEKKVAKAEKPTDTKGDKMESEEDKFQKRLDEEKRKWMEEHGMLESETGGPSASSGSKEDATAKLVAGEITTEQARKLGVSFI